MSRSEIHQRLLQYDGKQTHTLIAIAKDFGGHKTYIDDLILIAVNAPADLADGATWLIKHFVDEDGRLKPAQTHELMGAVSRFETWEAQLHICQILPALSLTVEDAQTMAVWLEPLLNHKRPFLRAWSLSALVAQAKTHDALKEAARAALAKAAEDPAASVRARVRKLSA